MNPAGAVSLAMKGTTLLSNSIMGFCPGVLQAQLMFTSGANDNQRQFERINGQSVPVNTGSSTHNYPGLSRNGRFLTYSAPDAPAGNGLNPSADIYLYDPSSCRTPTSVA